MNTSSKYKFHLLFVATCLFLAGCSKNLEEHPVSIISPGSFFKSDGDFQAAINGAVKQLYWGAGGYNTLIMTAGAEDVTSRETAPELTMYDKFVPSLTDSRNLGAWVAYYTAINDCNAIITNIATATGVSADNKKQYEGQARYIRALSYYYLTRYYGEVPIVTSENQVDAINLTQSPVADVYKVITDDLNVASGFLTATAKSKGLPTRGAVAALQSSVYLTMTGWPLKDVSKYALARDKAKEVMDLGVYDLEPNFADLWLVKNKTTNKEFIFALYGSATSAGTASSNHQRSRPGEEGGWNDFMSEPRFFNSFPNGPRKNASFWTVFADAGRTTWQNSRIAKPFIAKWRDGGSGATFEQGVVNSFDGDGFIVESRYSEVLLTYAEAANMAEGSPSPAALEAINKVRRRAGGFNQAVYPDLVAGMSKADFDKAVLDERAWELAFEAKRWFDLVRKELVVSVNKALYPNVGVHHMLLPKPQTELDLLKGLKQNPGYN